MCIRVLLSSKHTVISEGIAAILRTHQDMNVVGVSDNGQQTHALCQTEDPDSSNLSQSRKCMGLASERVVRFRSLQ